jgi:hypothetical protein
MTAFSAASLAFSAYWADPELVRDFSILAGCGRVSATCAARGDDNPAGWWSEAARAYTSDAGGRFARTTCQLVSAALAAGEAN